MNNIDQRVVRVISEQIGLNEADINPEQDFFEDLGGDSLDAIETIMALEEEFNIEISDEEAEKVRKVSEVIELVKRHVQ